MEFEKRHNTTDTTDLCPRQLVTDFVVYVADLLHGSNQLVTGLLRGNWCNGIWPLLSLSTYCQHIKILTPIIKK